jgi:hypothetical protein
MQLSSQQSYFPCKGLPAVRKVSLAKKLDHDRLTGIASPPDKEVSVPPGPECSEIQNLKTHRDLLEPE